MLQIWFAALFFAIFILPIPAPSATQQKTDYNDSEARMLVNLAAGAYADSPQGCINQTFGSYSLNYQISTMASEVCDDANSICSGYVLINNNLRRIYVVFRGTKTDIQLLYEGINSLEPLVDFYGVGLVNFVYKNF